ncbi:MAG: DNA-processing protein DprA [Spirochaetes bacterium]|nr:DNA-processing protein DprA [Spirochaetota bacterium]
MKGSRRRSLRGIPLFLNPTVLPTGDTRSFLFDLVLARMNFLSIEERLFLAAFTGGLKELLALDSVDIEDFLLRRITEGAWNSDLTAARAAADLEYFQAKSIVFIPIDNPSYPPQLRESYRPPFGLYLRGCLPDPERPAVAVVGTRVPTGRGLAAAFGLGAGLAASGVCVVSGLARGIDAAAHRGALSAKGMTLAVLPAGIESVYPPSNRGLAASIVDGRGGLVTEYPPSTEIHRYRFPERNRIIAALCRSCVVVEAPEKSGALITADHALAEGRDVFVHGACLGGARNAGADVLASQGAAVVNNAGDVFSEWADQGQPRPAALASEERF